jgi:hypothetical protein
MHLELELANIAEEYHAAILRWAPKNDGLFKSVITVAVGGTARPLLLVGSAHSAFADGQCIAVLNPSKELAAEILPGVAYTPAHLKKVAAGRCDCLVGLFIEHYKKGKKQVTLTEYVATSPRAVEISPRDFGA